eukprot:g9338.t1
MPSEEIAENAQSCYEQTEDAQLAHNFVRSYYAVRLGVAVDADTFVDCHYAPDAMFSRGTEWEWKTNTDWKETKIQGAENIRQWLEQDFKESAIADGDFSDISCQTLPSTACADGKTLWLVNIVGYLAFKRSPRTLRHFQQTLVLEWLEDFSRPEFIAGNRFTIHNDILRYLTFPAERERPVLPAEEQPEAASEDEQESGTPEAEAKTDVPRGADEGSDDPPSPQSTRQEGWAAAHATEAPAQAPQEAEVRGTAVAEAAEESDVNVLEGFEFPSLPAASASKSKTTKKANDHSWSEKQDQEAGAPAAVNGAGTSKHDLPQQKEKPTANGVGVGGATSSTTTTSQSSKKTDIEEKPKKTVLWISSISKKSSDSEALTTLKDALKKFKTEAMTLDAMT